MLESSEIPEKPISVAGGSSLSEEQRAKSEELDRSFGGNRWPREETLALLKIRSDMDAVFRDSNVKAPLWEEVSRKLGELGYQRNAKKCKEKFENIYKYHKRTKGGRSSRPNNRNYRFFEQLEALDSHPLLPPSSPEKTHPPMAASMMDPANTRQSAIPVSIQNLAADFIDTSTSGTSSSDKEGSDDGTGSEKRKKKKRKLTDFFETLMKSVVEKQEDLQRKFLQVMEKCERDRVAREEAWKREEAARMERERELLAQERSVSATRDAAVLAFLQKFSEQELPIPWPETEIPTTPSVERPDAADREESIMTRLSFGSLSSSRWPKEEVEALIRLRANLETADQENSSKGPLWEEISLAMRKLGYDRNAKRCKEKWENINKYFKKVKESKRKRPEDSKTCPYFHQLDALYKEKSNRHVHSLSNNPVNNPGFDFKPEELLLQMMEGQEQQQQQQQVESVTEEGNSENVIVNQNQEHNDSAGKAAQENTEQGYQIME